MAVVESKINFLRILTIGLCFALHTLAYYQRWPLAQAIDAAGSVQSIYINEPLHHLVSLLALAWISQALLIHLYLVTRSERLPLGLLSVLLDSLWLTSVIALTHGPGSGLVAAYFLIIATAAWRFDLRCVRLATAMAVVGYLVVLGFGKFSTGPIQPGSIIPVARQHQGMVLVALLVAGWIAAQIVRSHYAQPVAERESLSAGASTPESLSTKPLANAREFNRPETSL